MSFSSIYYYDYTKKQIFIIYIFKYVNVLCLKSFEILVYEMC